MRGFITDKHLGTAESCFPGIRGLYRAMPVKPVTFLDLVRAYRFGERDGASDDSGVDAEAGLADAGAAALSRG